MANTKKQAENKELTLVAIYKLKSNKKLNGTRCYLLRNEEGKEYKVWTHTFGCASSCNCDGFQKSHGRRQCYHIKFAEAREQLRKQAQSTANKPAEQKKQTAAAAPVATEPTAITDAEVEAVLAEIDAQAAAPVVVATTEPRKREVSSTEREMPAFLMAGGSRGGYLPGRAPSTKAS
jgi:hypothetical protein